MLNRRRASTLILSSFLTPMSARSHAQNSADDELLVPMDSPAISDLTKLHPFGSHPASEREKQEADQIIATTPTGPRPIDIAQSFYDRYYASNPHAISEWPKKESWNPLIARFFEATTLHTKQDTVAWCAAFLNWCLERAGKPATRDSGSQSFATTKSYKVTTSPMEGDIAVFTCYKPNTDSSYGIGHVTFFKKTIDGNHFLALGGNQSGKTPSIISEKQFPMRFASSRSVGTGRVPVEYRLNRFLHVA